MRLKQLKISGFKSFVDPTVVKFPSELVGIVGPNGCGKSNTIDAVRWVMGESSAKNLRGESITDVIFNGSSARKPVGQAQVELVFDNEDGSLGGAYAQYPEISIKRLVTREGVSNYYLNGTRCRRKDITDVFLGTGLGPRSYAIIEQGTISRIIEAKPDEMRVFLEEAAGISKYKERRRETETRMRHTRENLARVNDIRDELAKQLDRLHRQAEAAEKYKELKSQERLLRAQLLGLRWQHLQSKVQEQQTAITEQELKVEAYIAEQRHHDAEIEAYREKHLETQEIFQSTQTQYYQIGAEIARLEQAIANQQQRREQLLQDKAQAEAELSSALQLQTTDQARHEQVAARLVVIEPELQSLQQQQEQAQEQLDTIEQSYQEWQQRWDDFNITASQSSQQAHVAQAKVQHLEERLHQIQNQMQKAQQEQQQLNSEPHRVALNELAMQQEAIQESLQTHEATVQEFSSELQRHRQTLVDGESELSRARAELQTLKGREASLQELQAAALNSHDQAVKTWLSNQKISDAARLAQKLTVTSGWETAVEAVLGNYLQALLVDNIDELAGKISELKSGALHFLQASAAKSEQSSVSSHARLLDKISAAPESVQTILSGIYCVESTSEAVALAKQLAAREAVVTRDGLVLGATWLQYQRSSDAQSGVLAREQDLKTTQLNIETQEEKVSVLTQSLQDARAQLARCEEEREQARMRLSECNAQLSDLSAQTRVKQSQLENIEKRQAVLTTDITNFTQQFESCQMEIQNARQLWQEAMAAMDEHADRREKLISSRDEINHQLDESRQQAKAYRESAHRLQLEYQAANSERNALAQNIQRMSERLQQLTARVEGLKLALQQSENPADNFTEQLQTKLQQHGAAESELSKARVALENVEFQLRDSEDKRHEADNHARALQANVSQLKMAAQESIVRQQTIVEQLGETDYQLEALITELPPELSIQEAEMQLETLDRRISRLGAINLAAIDEYQTESERKQYLDSQYDDLTSALQTLENAIEKIDRETRDRFKETFDTVNNSFGILFPKLFGGGRAFLELTGTDLLDTGVTVMAQPPGKRNSSIHLLSGGEKALTAIALVFSIFQLNPAPFCMLDEVDAPLDDANVTRFCKLVAEMSKSLQFIFITHNKVTMELATHLCGVTMHEPGVSRLVSVDIDEAITLAEA